MATITVQNSAFTGLNHTYAAVTTGDAFTNDGNTFILFKNANVTARTLTLVGNAFSKPGFGDISAADAGETVTLPGSGTNGGECLIGPFPPDRFNNSSGQVTLAIDVTTTLTVAAVKLTRYA